MLQIHVPRHGGVCNALVDVVLDAVDGKQHGKHHDEVLNHLERIVK